MLSTSTGRGQFRGTWTVVDRFVRMELEINFRQILELLPKIVYLQCLTERHPYHDD